MGKGRGLRLSSRTWRLSNWPPWSYCATKLPSSWSGSTCNSASPSLWKGFFRITHTYNTGSAFGLFQGQNTPLIVVAIVGIFILGMIYRTQRPPSNLLRLSLGLQIGGAIGNLTDRLLFGHVTDFLDVGAWPIFNLADSSIVVGLVLLAWVFLRPGRRQTESTVESLDGPSPTGTAQPSDTRLERYEEYRRWMRLDR